MKIERYNSKRHNTEELKELLKMAMGNPTPEKVQKWLGTFYTLNKHAILVAINDRRITGMIGIDYSTAPHGYIYHLAVHPDYRKHGIGRGLLNYVAKTLGLISIALETDQDAVEFYRACGFDIEEIESKWHGVRRFLCNKDTSRDL
jgi:ribosomal protein S18 acetylase RimI-like enzyme